MLEKLLKHISTPSYKRTLSLLILLFITLSIPITITLLQKKQSIRQRSNAETSGGTGPCQCTYMEQCETGGSRWSEGIWNYATDRCEWDSSGSCPTHTGTCLADNATCECAYVQACNLAGGGTGVQTCDGIWKIDSPTQRHCGWDPSNTCFPKCSTCVPQNIPSPTISGSPTPSPTIPWQLNTCEVVCGTSFCYHCENGAISCDTPCTTPAPPAAAPPYTQNRPENKFIFDADAISPDNIPHGINALSNVSNTFVSLLVALGMIFAILFIVYAGIKFITAGGDKEKIESAKRTLTYAIVGLLIIVLSFAIIRLIGSIIGARFMV